MANEVFDSLTFTDVDIASEEAIPYCIDLISETNLVTKKQVRSILEIYRAELRLRLMRKKF